VDFSSTAVQQAADKYPQHQWDCADATRLSGLADRSLDIVICYGSWEHFDDPLQAIREAGRVLKPGGLVLALLPTLGVYRTDTTTEGFYADLPASTPGGPQQMQWNLTRASWEAMFAAAAVALFNNQLAASCGAQKPDVFFFGMRLNV
jgi:ubiquinone/menaquinone biosynthesis C-methylase UbiE